MNFFVGLFVLLGICLIGFLGFMLLGLLFTPEFWKVVFTIALIALIVVTAPVSIPLMLITGVLK
jgi:hypothetical protein